MLVENLMCNERRHLGLNPNALLQYLPNKNKVEENAEYAENGYKANVQKKKTTATNCNNNKNVINSNNANAIDNQIQPTKGDFT